MNAVERCEKVQTFLGTMARDADTITWGEYQRNKDAIGKLLAVCCTAKPILSALKRLIWLQGLCGCTPDSTCEWCQITGPAERDIAAAETEE